MKKINIVLLSFLVLAASLVSCSNLLEEDVYSELLVNTAYETEEDAEVLVLAAYSALRGSDWGAYYEYDYLTVSEAPTDIYGQDQWEAGTFQIEMGTYGNTELYLVNCWSGAYKVIGAANIAIGVLEDMDIDESVKAAYIGEAKFLRGLAYYDLAFNWGDVILNIGETNENLPLSPQSEVIAQVISDFTDAANVLGDWSTPGRASKGAALGLRMKTHLNAKNWQAAADDANAVMQLGEFELMESVEEVFNVNNNGENEWIFAVMSAKDGVGANSQIPWFALLGSYQNGGWGRLSVAGDFYNSFELTDERRSLIGNGYQAGNMRMFEEKPVWYAWPGSPEHDQLAADPAISLTDLSYDGLGVIKYGIGCDRFTYSAISYNGVNYPVLRYADILLSRAEALNELGTGDPLTLVNQIRARSNATPLEAMGQADMRDAILDERALEFYQEGHRRLDLIRSGKYADLWRANLEAKYPGETFPYLEQKIFFPIPQVELDANDQIGN